MRVIFSPEAAADLEAAVAWWRANRAASSVSFSQELRRAVAQLRRLPKSGAPALDVALDGVRRLHLLKLRHCLYYEVTDAVYVLRLWHTSRGSLPPTL